MDSKVREGAGDCTRRAIDLDSIAEYDPEGWRTPDLADCSR